MVSRPDLQVTGLMSSWAELSTGLAEEGGLDGMTGTLQSTADKGWGATHFGLVSRRQRSQGQHSCSRSHDAESERVRRANAHGRGGEEALDGVERVGVNRSL
eukprot:2561400-Rhodomonas_salina.1